MKWKTIIITLVLVISYLYLSPNKAKEGIYSGKTEELNIATTTIPETKKKELLVALPTEKMLQGLTWVGQSFNNCSSVGLMITLSYWGITDTQEKIAEATRPWNNSNGNNDDKSVTLYELADYAKAKHGTLAYVRPNGNIETLKKFIANDIPVLTRTLMYPLDDIVHYRVVRGYDETKKIIIESDGYYGPNHTYSYEEWMHLWKDFNYSYLIIVPKEKQELVERLLGEELSEQIAWQNAKDRALGEVSKNSNDLRAKYNEITARYYLHDYEGTVREFEKIEDKLTRRKLWYQMEPIDAYFTLGKFDRVITLTDEIINDKNKSVSELYVLRGKIYQSRGDIVSAKAEYQKAIYYNKSLPSAKEMPIVVGE